MKKLQRKILILVISSVLISAFVVMSIAVFNYDRIITSNSQQIMQLMCSDKQQVIDEKLLNIEQSVHTLYHFAEEQIRINNNLFSDETKYEEYMSRMSAILEINAKYTDGAVSVYYVLNPNLKGSRQGIWLVKNEENEFFSNEVTDVSQYDKEDIEHAGWYYIPLESGKETWINPYYNQNMNREIISYVIPLIIDGQEIGVVGMDVDTHLLYETTKAVTVFDTGYAFLMDNEGKFVYHPEMKGSVSTPDFDSGHAYLYEKSLLSAQQQSVQAYQWNAVEKRLTSQKLRNGMIFTVCATNQEIIAPQQRMLSNSILVIVLILSIFILVTVSVTKAIVSLMYTDPLTRVRNKTAYSECVEEMYKRIKGADKVHFTVIVSDINDLKKVNDTYGHEFGDQLIQNGANVLKRIWKADCVYRIGGDEFAIVRLNAKEDMVKNEIILMEEELTRVNSHNSSKELYLQMAVGMAVYNPETDKGYMDVFRRADAAMYEDKKIKKECVGSVEQ